MKRLALAFLTSSLLFACTTEEVDPIDYGRDQCAYCMMSISDPKFGAELITDKGRVLKYDAAECLVAHLDAGAPTSRRLLAVPYDRPNSLVDVEQLTFLISADFHSPMGADLAAFSDSDAVPEAHRSEAMDWDALRERLGK